MTWWQWLMAAYIVLVVLGFAVFLIAANRAPMDTDIWPGGEPE